MADILVYISRSNPVAAERAADQLEATVLALAEQPIARAGPGHLALALSRRGVTICGIIYYRACRAVQIKHLDINGGDLRVVLLPRLRERVFHVTSQANFEKIRRARAVLHNRDRRFPLNIASENSFGRKKGWVCLFDLRNCDDQTLEDTLDNKYCFLRPPWFVKYEPNSTISNVCYLFLDSRAQSELVSYKSAKRECPCGHYIPKTEAWYPGEIPLPRIESVLLVTSRTEAPTGYARVLHEIEYRDQQQKSIVHEVH